MCAIRIELEFIRLGHIFHKKTSEKMIKMINYHKSIPVK